MRARSAVTLVALLVGLVACTGEGGSRDDAGATRPPTTAPTTPFGVSSALDTQKAGTATAGRQYRPGSVSPAHASGGRTLTVLDVTSGGGLVAAANPAPKTGDGTVTIGQSEMGLQRGAGFAPFPKARRTCSDRPRQAVYADERDGVVVWTESASTNLYVFDWCVFAYTPKTGTTTLLGDSAAVSHGKDMPEAPGSSAPSIGDGKAYWATAYPTTGKREFGVRVVAQALNGGGEPATVADGAKLPRAAGKDLYYVRSADVSPDFPKDRYEIRRVTPDGEDALVTGGPLPTGREITALTVAGDHVSWVVAAPEQQTATLYALDTRTKKAVTFALGHAAPATMFLRSTPQFLAWGNGSAAGDAGQYVYDFAHGRLWRLGTEDGFSVVYAKGSYLAWSKLPTAPTEEAGSASFETAKWSG
ncbi:hypothetical protein ACGFMM_11880 [Streptomyces sp. NPDC048604]|uniref:hypothetical protein n=1 Tax=Streptomyces sp. NPDC048604 TaxID=3365578 RepID=UPI003711C596